jgi:hypothetical protein
VTVAERLEQAHAAAAEHAGDGERVLAVLPAEPGRGALVFLAAYGPPDDAPTYLGLDAGHRPVRDEQLVKDAVTMLALAETAEEVAGATLARELRDALLAAEHALRLAGRAGATASLLQALDTVERVAEGPRIATPRYLDALAAAAGDLAAAIDDYQLAVDELGRSLAEDGRDPVALEPAWQPLALLARSADPGSFSAALAATTGAVEALVADVLQRYRVPLV